MDCFMTDSAATCGLYSSHSRGACCNVAVTGFQEREWKYAGLPEARLATALQSLPSHSSGQSTSHYQAAHIQNVGKLSPPVTEEMQKHVAQGRDMADHGSGPLAQWVYSTPNQTSPVGNKRITTMTGM